MPDPRAQGAGPSAGRTDAVDAAAERLGALLAGYFSPLEDLAAAVVETRAASPSPSRLTERALLHLEGSMREALEGAGVVGVGFIAAPGIVENSDRYLLWWQRKDDEVTRLRLNFDPSSVDVYDYLTMDWFVRAREGARHVVYGPYVDYTGADHYIFTLTAPARSAEGEYLGVAGCDVLMTSVERALIDALRDCPRDTVVVSSERRVIAVNSPRWVIGARLPTMPDAGSGDFVAVADVGLDSGWVVSSAVPEE